MLRPLWIQNLKTGLYKERGIPVIKFLLLDLDDTILDFKLAEKIAISDTLRELGIEPTEEITSLYSEINKACWEKLERGEYTRQEVLYNRFAILFEKLGVKLSPADTKKIYETRLGIGHYFIPGAPEFLEKIKDKYELYITSNGTAKVQSGRIASSGISKYFKEIFVSENLGVNKPSKLFFDKIFEKIDGFDKEKAIIVGDSLSSDILGGINAGIKTCWFNPHHKENKTAYKPDYEIDSLDRLPELLKNIK